LAVAYRRFAGRLGLICRARRSGFATGLRHCSRTTTNQGRPLISAALAVLAGLILLARPVQGVLTLTIVVGAYFLAEGVTTIMYALEHRRELSERWSRLLIAGLVDILIAFIIITGLPGSAEWAIGLLVGINLLFGGATLIGMALAARNA